MTGKHPATLMTAVMLLLAVGCGESTPPPSVDETITGIQASVVSFIETAQNNPKGPAGDATSLIEQLEGRVAEYGDRFQPVLDEARKFQEIRQGNSSQTDLESQLGKLRSAADQL